MTSSPPERRRTMVVLLIGLMVVALFLRLAYLFTLEIETPIRADARAYVMTAVNLSERGVYSSETEMPPRPTAFYTPGYPFFLLAVLKSSSSLSEFVRNTYFAQAVLSAVTVGLLFMLAVQCMPVLMAAGAALCVSLSPHLTVFAGYLLTETLFIFALVASLLWTAFVIRHPTKLRWLLVGVGFGVAALVRPAILLFPVALLAVPLFMYARKSALSAGAMVLIGLVAIWAPWSVWKQTTVPPAISAMAASLAFGSYPDMVHKSQEHRGYPYREDDQYAFMNKSASNAVSVIAERVAES
ncbi:MAG: glycosyltransferase family 39 protein, partial [Gammaproteobacteria bacterium]|nr:glycosyltransferase family 39 protein [Gammaproteobacteria bacterium]